MRAPILTALTLLLVGTFAPEIRASEVSVCMESWPPYYTLNDDGVAVGAAVDALDVALGEAGHEASYLVLPYGRCMQQVRLGKIDAVLTLSPGETGFVYVGIPLAYWEIAAVVHKDDPIQRFKSLDQFDGYTLVYYTSYSYPESLANLMSRPNAIGIPAQEDTLQPLRIIQSRARHFAVVDRIWVKRVVREEGLEISVLEPPIATQPNYLAFSRQQADLAETIERSLRRMSSDGRLQRIYERHIDVVSNNAPGGS
ncbi:MAG: transporter substrate-binding domain-containing protein [Alphaproteobacteria bacterium]|nr:transporter substrate-binding domain-containing protein [Alphaproteobacteria bacterium]